MAITKINTPELLDINTTGAKQLPSGTTAQRPTTGVTAGDFRYNTDDDRVEYYDGTSPYDAAKWFQIDDEALPSPVPVGSENFDIVTYTGTGNAQSTNSLSNQSGTINFAPDLVWIKSRSNGTSHELNDSVRGQVSRLFSDSTSAQGTIANGFLSLDSNGFSLNGAGSGGEVNALNRTYVAWCWKAGGAPTATNSAGAGNVPTAGSVKIDGADSTTALAGIIAATRISANTDAGFSIVSYAGASNATADASNNGGAYWSVGHGLGATPDLVIVKKTNDAGGWYVGGAALGSTGSNGNHLVLNTSAAQAPESNILWGGGQTFNDTTFGLGGWDVVNRNGDSYIAYCFKSIIGYQKVGTYLGNGPTGQPIPTGFEPSFLLIRKADDSQSWIMLDNVRDPSNPKTKTLLADTNGIETVTTQNLSFTSTGFTLSNFHVNDSGTTFIFLAIA